MIFAPSRVLYFWAAASSAWLLHSGYYVLRGADVLWELAPWQAIRVLAATATDILRPPLTGLAVLIMPILLEKVVRFQPPPYRRFRKTRFLIFTLVIYASVVLLRSTVCDVLHVPSGSMKPTLQVGDSILVYRLPGTLRRAGFTSQAPPRRGDIILFEHPLQPDVLMTKRIIGLPGEQIVASTEGLLLINGIAPQRSPVEAGTRLFRECLHMDRCITILDQTPDIRASVPVTVLPDHVFVLGDNRTGSSDSRDGWQVPVESIKGRVVRILWSADPAGSKTLLRRTRWSRIGAGIGP